MSEHYLRKVDDDMGKAEWKMYRAIPAEEIGWENAAHHMDYEQWREYLKRQIAKEFRDQPKLTYIMYLEQYPIGVAKLKYDSDNESSREVAYCIRPICRSKGLGKVMLELLKKEAKELGITELAGYANKHNVASCKTMESCGFEFVELSEWGSNKYKISL
jgi:predicted acetyltransferase